MILFQILNMEEIWCLFCSLLFNNFIWNKQENYDDILFTNPPLHVLIVLPSTQQIPVDLWRKKKWRKIRIESTFYSTSDLFNNECAYYTIMSLSHLRICLGAGNYVDILNQGKGTSSLAKTGGDTSSLFQTLPAPINAAPVNFFIPDSCKSG